MFEPGSQIGRYEIQRRLGRGGMGTVYVAHDPVLGRMVAVKVFAGDLDVPDARERFAREARASAALSHPNIVTVYDFGEADGQPFIVMEYVPGETLAGLIRRKVPVTIADKLRWMEELAAGAGYAHQMQVVHRDIKPANLMIDRTGRLKILDFGIARMLGIASNTSVMIGTPGYMAPEQITGDPVDHRADQFSIGVVLYEVLAYTEAFPGDTLPMITHKILTAEPVPLERLVPDAGPEITGIVAKALKKNAAERFADSEALRVAISRVRRQYSSSAAWNAPTIAAGRDTPPASAGNRGTGSARHRQDNAAGVAQLTPPPDPRRTDREALARRRTAQLEAALQEARRLLAQDALDEALDACQQALTFDETHTAALELEQDIQAALRTREQESVASALTSATGNTDPRLSPDMVTYLGEVPVAGGLSPGAGSEAADRTVLRLPVAHADATIVAPARRTPAPASPATAMPMPPSAPVARATGVSVPEAKVAPVATAPVAKTPTERPRVQVRTRANEVVARAQALVMSVRTEVLKKVPRDRRMALWAVAGVGLLALVAAGAMLLTWAAAPTGSVVVDAVPWGTITAVESEGGEAQALPPETSTPVSLTLPAGNYSITLAGPTPDSQPQRISVRVEAGAASVAPLARFAIVTPEAYFEEYLASPVSPATPVETTPAGAPVPEPAPPAPTGVTP